MNKNMKSAFNAKTKGEELLTAFADFRLAMKEMNAEKGTKFAPDLVKEVNAVNKVKSSVEKPILLDVVKKMETALLNATSVAPIESALKPVKKEEKTKEEPKKLVKEVTPQSAKLSIPMAKMFPLTIENETLGTLVAATGKYHTKESIVKAVAEDKILVFATWWTPRHITQFAYAVAYDVPAPKAFPNDLDLMTLVFIPETVDKVYTISAYTEAILHFNSDDLKEIVDEDENGKHTMRISNGLEYQIYEQTEEPKPVVEAPKKTIKAKK